MRAASLVLLLALAGSFAHAQEPTTNTADVNHELMAAIHNRNANRALELIRETTRLNFVEDGTTPLIEAIALDMPTVGIALLDAGADPNLLAQGKLSPLMAACWYGQKKLVMRLLELGAHVNASDNDGYTPLMWAAGSMYTVAAAKIIAVLLGTGAKVNVRSNDGETPLTTAAFGGNEQAVRSLIAAGANVAAVNEDGETASTLACGREIGRKPSHTAICTLLQTHGMK